MIQTKGYVTALASRWVYERPNHGGAKTLLLNIGGVTTTGNWAGELGESFFAWAPLPKRNKALEARLFAGGMVYSSAGEPAQIPLGREYASAPVSEWLYERPRHRDSKCLLLTIGCIAIVGNWQGDLGQYFLAWAPFPDRDKAAEARIAQAYRERRAARVP